MNLTKQKLLQKYNTLTFLMLYYHTRASLMRQLLQKNKCLLFSVDFFLLGLTQHPIFSKWWFFTSLKILKLRITLGNRLRSIWKMMITVMKISKISVSLITFRKKQSGCMDLWILFGLEKLNKTTKWMDFLCTKEPLHTLCTLEIITPKNILKNLWNSDLKGGKMNVTIYLLSFWEVLMQAPELVLESTWLWLRVK